VSCMAFDSRTGEGSVNSGRGHADGHENAMRESANWDHHRMKIANWRE